MAEREYNFRLASELELQSRSYSVLLPQKKAAEIAGAPDFAAQMFKYCIETLDACDCVIAVLDGADADSGTCVEIGRAAARGKIIVGVRTDLRESEDRGLNLMVSHSCSRLLLRPSGSIREVAEAIHQMLFVNFPERISIARSKADL
jgi:nucleoside 2-deoxyribosyltransferase